MASPATHPRESPISRPMPITSSPVMTPSIQADDVDPLADGPRRRPQRAVTVEGEASHDRHPTRGQLRDDTSETRRSSRRKNTIDPNAGPIRRMTSSLFTPEVPVGPAPTFMASLKAAVFSSWVNVLLVFIPVSWALHFVKSSGNTKITDTAVFCTAFIAIIPLAGLLGFATEEAALRLGQTLGGLLNATLGNVVELLVAILALVKCELAVVQSSLVGSILSNLLLVLGCCFFAGGIRYSEQNMKGTAGQLNMSLLLLSVIAVLIPSAFHFAFNSTNNATEGGTKEAITGKEASGILSMSHGVSIILLIIYVAFTIFSMWTHAHLYEDEEVTGSTRHPEGIHNAHRRLKRRLLKRRKRTVSGDEEATARGSGEREPKDGVMADGETRSNHTDESDDEEVPEMNMPVTLLVMLVVASLVGVTAEFLVDSIDGMVEANPALSREWVGLILLPIVGNAAEYFTAVSVSVKDKLDLSISVAVGSSIQVALFVIPVIELLAWTIGKPMTLLFDPFEAVTLFFSVLIVNQTLADNKSNWMEGAILMLFYVLLAVAFWFYPGSNTATLLGCAEHA